MTLLRRNSNFGSYDIAPQLQATLNANGMQAHLSQTPSGEMQLITLAHNSSTPRYYTLTQSQVENLRSGETNSFNRKAYETFTANSTSKCKITKCFCKSTPLVLRNSIFFLVSH